MLCAEMLIFIPLPCQFYNGHLGRAEPCGFMNLAIMLILLIVKLIRSVGKKEQTRAGKKRKSDTTEEVKVGS